MQVETSSNVSSADAATGAGRPRGVFAWLAVICLALAVVLTGAWGTLALWFRFPGSETIRFSVAAGWSFLTLCAIVVLVSRKPRLGRAVGAVYGLAFLAMVGWWISIKPSNDRVWETEMSRLPTATMVGNRLTIHNVRDFDWRSESDFSPRWETRTYDLDDVRGVDLFFSYWAGPAIAHVIVSFDFAKGPPLAFSIETRRQKGEPFGALDGFFKQYELIIIPADERDVVRVRSNVRGEDVRLYRLGVSPQNARKLLLRYAEEIDRLSREPAFYNTLRDNCTTLAFGFASTIWPLSFDWRVLLSGYGPAYAYDIKAVDTRVSFDELVRLARIHDRAVAAGDSPDFSARIREGVPQPVD